jgi:hypothetical protein
MTVISIFCFTFLDSFFVHHTPIKKINLNDDDEIDVEKNDINETKSLLLN